MIKINKQLQRPDGGNVSSGSIIDYNTKMVGKNMSITYYLMHYFSESALESEKETISAITNFKYRIVRMCNAEEWTELMTGADAGPLVQTWLQEMIDEKIGEGNTEII